MAMVNVDNSSTSRSANSRSKRVGLVSVLAATWHSVCIHQNELGKLLQWLCHDNSTTNINGTLLSVFLFVPQKNILTYLVLTYL